MWLPCDMEASLQELASIDNQTFFGIPIQQTWTALYMLEKLVTEQQFYFVVELGTGAGALTQFFKGCIPRIGTFDIKDGYDVFGPDVKEWVSYFMKKDGQEKKTMIFCDDGDKPREIREYAPLLKRGDFILGHDYRRPGGIPESFDYGNLGLETYNQDDWDRMKTYILCLRKKQ